jgi:hypothetical protein
MKKVFLFLTAIFIVGNIFTQSPNAFKYQAIIRDAGGNILTNHIVGIKISILQGNVSGTVVYSEVHKDTTNSFGLINLKIGYGLVLSGNFSSIDWGYDNYFIRIELDPTGGTSYQLMGTSQLLSVPYALYSKEAENVKYHQVLSKSGDTIKLSNGGYVIDANTLYKAGDGIQINVDTIINSKPGYRICSQSEIDAIIPTAGTMVYNTTTNQLNIYNGSNWYELQYGECVPHPTVADAGSDQTKTNDSVFNLAANTPVYGIGTWNILSGSNGSISNKNDPDAVFTGRVGVTYTLRWTIKNGCDSTFDNVNIQIICAPAPIAEAGPDQSSTNGAVVTMAAAAPTHGTGTWNIISGGSGFFSNIHDSASTYTANPIDGTNGASYVLSWTVTNTCGSTSDNVNVNVGCGSNVFCSGQCKNLGNDNNNCGSCGHACGTAPNATLGCSGGVCQITSCAPGYADCDGNPANGCETDINNDSQNCGACGYKCASGYHCSGGGCVKN